MNSHGILSAAVLSAVLFTATPTVASAADGSKSSHSHDHGHDHAAPARSFSSLAEGLTTLDALLKKAETAAGESKAAAFHDLGLELHAIADGLAVHRNDVPQPKRMRFDGAVNQLRAVGDRMHDLPAGASAADTQRLVAQAHGIERIVKANSQ